MEIEDLTKKQSKMHDSWIKHSCSELSAHEIKQKLEQINTAPQTDIFLQQISDVNKEVLSKTTRITEVKQKLESKELQHIQLVEKLQQDIATKNSYVEQVHANPLNMYLMCD